MNYFKESVFKPLGDYFVEINKNGDVNLNDYLDAMFQHDPTFQINLAKEQNKFLVKFGLLDESKIKLAKIQQSNREILANTISSKI